MLVTSSGASHELHAGKFGALLIDSALHGLQVICVTSEDYLDVEDVMRVRQVRLISQSPKFSSQSGITRLESTRYIAVCMIALDLARPCRLVGL